MKEFYTETNKRIAIYDDLFTLQQRLAYYSFCTKSSFLLGWADSLSPKQIKHKFLYSPWTEEELQRCGVLEAIKNSSAAKELEGYYLEKTILNLSVASNSHFAHTHEEHKVILYYPNLEWEDGWHGETVFYDDAGKEIIFSNVYVPGRLCIFDPSIPHAIRPPSTLGSDYRFTLGMLFKKC